MAGAAGRRNILKELTSPGISVAENIHNVLLPMTPPSPDETVIQRRGHCKKTATYNYNSPDPFFFKSPIKSPKKSSPIKKPCTPTRSSPRKRLNLTLDNSELNETGIYEMNSYKRVKKMKLQNIDSAVDFEKGVLALSRDQLVGLISNAARSCPEVQKIFNELLPLPDLSPIESKLQMLQRNIFKSYPRNVWGSQDDSFCFLRVRTHLEAFKMECLQQCSLFMESQHWSAVFECILLAWKFTVGLPNWSNAAHNKIKISCMKQISSYCISALKKSSLNRAALLEIIERMKEFQNASSVSSCIKFAEKLLNTQDCLETL